jgi:hypothetical protein
LKEFHLLRLSDDSCNENITADFSRPVMNSDPTKNRFATVRLLYSLGVNGDDVLVNTVQQWQTECCGKDTLTEKLTCYQEHANTHKMKIAFESMLRHILGRIIF